MKRLNKKLLQKIYDDEGSVYDERRFFYPGGIYVDEKEKETVLTYLKKGSVLEIGTGTSRYGPFLKEKDFDFFGVDISGGMLRAGKNRDPSLKLAKMDAENLGFASNTFDNVFFVRVFRIIPDSLKTLREINRVLRKRGRVIIIYESKSHIFQRLFLGFMKKIDMAPGNYFADKEFEELMRKANFKVIYRTSVLNFGFYKYIRSQIVMDIISGIDKNVETGWRSVIVGEKR